MPIPTEEELQSLEITAREQVSVARQNANTRRATANADSQPVNATRQNNNVRQQRPQVITRVVVDDEGNPIPGALAGIAPSIEHSGVPINDVPLPAPINSVYDRRHSPSASPSELGLMPLQPLQQPLQSVEPATVFQAPQPFPTPRTTFREPSTPRLAPILPSMAAPTGTAAGTTISRPAPVSRGCDCGKPH